MIELHNALAVDKSSLIGETVEYYGWENSDLNYFMKCLEWMEDNFIFYMRAEQESLLFFVINTKRQRAPYLA